MKLIGSAGSPFARKVRIVFAEKAIPFEFVLDRPSAPDTKVPQFNPLGQVPVLVLDDGSTIYDSPVIVEYLDGLVPAKRLIPEKFEQRIQVKRWEALGDGVAEAAVHISHERRKPAQAQESAQWYERQQQKIERGLKTMASDLGDKPYCFGERFGLADIATGYALDYVDKVLKDYDWRAQYPKLQKLAAKLAERPSFRDTQPPPA
jgi:glutathione S-transferase